MNIREFAVVIVRFFGLWLLFQCINMVEGVISSFYAPFFKESPEYNEFIKIVGIFNLLVNAVVAVVLTWRPQIVADRLPLPSSREKVVRLKTASLIFLGFSVSGTVFVILGLKSLAYQGVVWWSAPSGPMFQTNVKPAEVATSIFEILIGLWLVCGFKSIVRGIRRIWRSGRTFGQTCAEKDTKEKGEV